MNIDSYYTNGKLHGHKGEDYAIHGEDWFIICDGCSSANHSDVAARIQAHIMKININAFAFEEYGYEDYKNMITYLSWSIVEKFRNLQIEGLPLATLIVGFKCKDTFKVLVVGDGVVYHKTKNGLYELLDLYHDNEIPLYPAYFHGTEKMKEYTDLCRKTDTQRHLKIDNDDNCIISYPPEGFHLFEFPISEGAEIFAFSDGVKELMDTSGRIELPTAVKSFTSIKNSNGNFIERRCARQLKLYEKDGVLPYDDFSMAGVVF